MRVYQCIHNYPPHMSFFEKKYGVNDDMDFKTLHRLVIEDGYASTYILQPALEGKVDEVFFTLWNYERLQLLWAKEHSLNSSNLDEIKLAQIEEYKPDVFYNMSAVYDDNFISKLGRLRSGIKCVYWNGIIANEPKNIFGYDGHISLHKPFVDYWRSAGLAACELQPGIPDGWVLLGRGRRNADVMFYGQYAEQYFSSRAETINRLIAYMIETGTDVRCHLQYDEKILGIIKGDAKMLNSIGCISKLLRPFITFPKKRIRENSLMPLYGGDLYQAIGQSKIIVNGFTDYTGSYKSNMRLFEAIGLGAFLITEEGAYPEGFEPGIDFYTYDSLDALISNINRVLNDWPVHYEMAVHSRSKITELYSKERQWEKFQEFIGSL